MKLIRFVILPLLLVSVLGYWIYSQQRAASPELLESEPAGGDGAEAVVSEEGILADGSFNMIAPRKREPAEDPAKIAGSGAWRERYRAALPPRGGAGVYVYPFCDATRRGVGMAQTWGSHVIGNLALALWTDAKVPAGPPPIRFGMPAPEPGAQPSPEEAIRKWKERALADPAAADAQYVVIGAYRDGLTSQTAALQVELIDRTNPGDAKEIFKSESATGGADAFANLAAAQREFAQTLPARLEEAGAAKRRSGAPPAGIELGAELRETAQLLDSSDAWTTMDGVDRALGLAVLFPSSSAPLQAAGLGIEALRWTCLSYGESIDYSYEYAFRAYAFAQAALALAPEAALARMQWAYSGSVLGQPANPEVARHGRAPDWARASVELEGMRKLYAGENDAVLTRGMSKRLPDWTVFAAEGLQHRHLGTSQLTPYLEQRIPHADKSDFYLQALMARDGYRARDNSTTWGDVAAAADLATAATLAAELAAVAAALQHDPAAEALLSAGGALEPGVPRKLLDAAGRGGYYAAREAAAEALGEREAPYEPDAPETKILALLEGLGAHLALQPGLRETSFGVPGFEFAPFERFQFMARRDFMGTKIAVSLHGGLRGDRDALHAYMNAYLGARPTNAVAWRFYSGHADNRLSEPGTIERCTDALTKAGDYFALDAQYLLDLARIDFEAEREEEGLARIRAYARSDPFATYICKDLGEFCDQYGFTAEAERYYARFIEIYPRRYDIAQRRAFLQCAMGGVDDPKLEPVFENPAKELVGNSSFHTARINFWLNWRKDYARARQAADWYRQHKGAYGWMTLADVDIAEGKLADAEQNLAKADISGLKGITRAGGHAALAQRYMEMKRLDLAEKHVVWAEEIDNWKGDVIEARADLEFAKGRYQEALNEYTRSIQRYGDGANDRLQAAICYEKLGNRARAIELLEEKVVGKSPHQMWWGLVAELMRLYADAGEKEKARTLMEQARQPSGRNRAMLAKTIEEYSRIDPAEGAALEARINEIMAGPPLL